MVFFCSCSLVNAFSLLTCSSFFSIFAFPPFFFPRPGRDCSRSRREMERPISSSSTFITDSSGTEKVARNYQLRTLARFLSYPLSLSFVRSFLRCFVLLFLVTLRPQKEFPSRHLRVDVPEPLYEVLIFLLLFFFYLTEGREKKKRGRR